jgi:RNA polymerase sigma-70 factor (ECF subfamily)
MTSALFQDVIERHGSDVRGFLRRRLRNPTLAEEATQETFVRAYAKHETLRDPAKMGAWLIGIARRVSAEAQRRQRLVPVGEVPEDSLGLAPSPETELLERETSDTLARAVARLGEGRREALRLRVEDELPYDDIATRLGWTLAKVKNELHRARRELERALAAGLVLVALGASVPRLGTLGAEVGSEGAGAACFDSVGSTAAALESLVGACLLASPVLTEEPRACVDETPVCGG